MLDKIKKWFNKSPPAGGYQPAPTSEGEKLPPKNPSAKPSKPRKPKQKKVEQPLNAKELATANNEPYINILKVEIDPENINNGSFELDWNDKFVLNLIRAGYKIREDDTEQQIVDRWFQTVCRGIALELYEQQQADPEKRGDVRVIHSRDLGNGRTEVS